MISVPAILVVVAETVTVDILKIDQSFVSGILKDRHDATIAETIISMTKHFDFACLAEGVECVEEMEWLKQRSCRYMQALRSVHR